MAATTKDFIASHGFSPYPLLDLVFRHLLPPSPLPVQSILAFSPYRWEGDLSEQIG
jgi:hypothetical protein